MQMKSSSTVAQINGRVIIIPGEQIAKTSYKSKRFVTKVMFLGAVAGARNEWRKESLFDRIKVLRPFVETTAPKLSTANRPKGAPVTAALSVDKQLYRMFFIEKLFPAVRIKFPFGSG